MGTKCDKCNKSAPLLASLRGWGWIGDQWLCPTHRLEERKEEEMDLALKYASLELSNPEGGKVAIDDAMKSGDLHQEAVEEARKLMAIVDTVGGAVPKCPSCGTVYYREKVIREIKKQSPEIFDFKVWSTTFKCLKCGVEVPLTGTRAKE